MNLLICTLGSSDLSGLALEPVRQLNERERAQYLLDHWSTDQIDLPIIGKALRYVQRQPGELAGIILVASDQGAKPPADPQARADWAKDTCISACVIAKALAKPTGDWQPLPPEQIMIWTIADAQGVGCDPSDYDAVRRFFERKLLTLRAAYPDATSYLAVTGGTPAMTTGLLVAGTEVFGARAEVLYLHPRRALPATLNTGRRLQSGPLRAALRSNMATYDYDAALRLLRTERVVISDRLAPGAIDLLEALLEYARRRFNFDLLGARRALEQGVDRTGDGRWRAIVMDYYQAVYEPDHHVLLAEVYQGALARYSVGAYPDFLTQVVRFQENALRLLCLNCGAVFIDQAGQVALGGRRLDPAWIIAQGLPERATKELSRGTLRWLLTELTRRNMAKSVLPLPALERLEGLARLRNDLTHTFAGVDKGDLARAFSGPSAPVAQADAIMPHMAQILAQVTGQVPSPSPYDSINHFLATLLHEAEPI